MKLLFASDLHGSATALHSLARRVEEEVPDRIVLLGDLLYHGPRNNLPLGYAPKEVIPILNSWSDRIVAVRGNCDAEVDQMVLAFPCRSDYALLEVDGHLLFLTHGHIAGMTPDNPPVLAAGSAYISGHTHVKTLEQRNGKLFVNPGSVSIPKDNSASYATYDKGQFALKDISGKMLTTYTW